MTQQAERVEEKTERPGTLEMCKGFMRSAFEEMGDFMMHVCVVATVDPKTGEPYEGGEARIMIANVDGSGKEEFSLMLRALLEKSKAKSITFMSEAWTRLMEPGEERTHRDLSQDPKRGEILMLIHETRDHSEDVHLRAWITRDAEGKPTLGPWEKMGDGMGGAGVQGRFARFFPATDMKFN